MRREGDVCRPDSLVRPAPLPEHLPSPQAPIEDVIENEHDKGVITEGQKTEGEQDTGILYSKSNRSVCRVRRYAWLAGMKLLRY